MEDRFANLSRIDFTWDRSRKKLNLRREELPPVKDSPIHPAFDIPLELTLYIISFLDVVDVLYLGSCSKLLNQLCNSDSVWKNLFVKRWSDSSSLNAQEEWKDSYISKHKEIGTTFSDHFRSLEVEEIYFSSHLDALNILINLQVGFEDVCLLFSRKLRAPLNLIGLHYAFVYLGVSSKDLIDALSRYKVRDRQVTMYWSFYDCYSYPSSYNANHYTLTVSFNDIANGEEAIFDFLEYEHDTPMRLRGLRISSF